MKKDPEQKQSILADVQLGIEYRAFENVGLGIGLGSNALKVKQETSEKKFVFDNRVSGFLIYTAACC